MSAESSNPPPGDGNGGRASLKTGLTSGDQSTDEDSIDDRDLKRQAEDGGDYSNLERLRKQKRLAMNRASARNRRRQKKEMLETLEKQVEELRRVNNGLLSTNQTLTTRIGQLETELGDARNAIVMLTGAQSTNAAANAPPASPNTAAATLPGAPASTLVSSLSSILPALAASNASAPAANPSTQEVLSTLMSTRNINPSMLSTLSSALGGRGLLSAVANASNQQTAPPPVARPVDLSSLLSLDQQGLQNVLAAALSGAVSPVSNPATPAEGSGQDPSCSSATQLEGLLGSFRDPALMSQIRRAMEAKTDTQIQQQQPDPVPPVRQPLTPSPTPAQHPPTSVHLVPGQAHPAPAPAGRPPTPAQPAQEGGPGFGDATSGIVALLARFSQIRADGESTNQVVTSNRSNGSNSNAGGGTKRPSVDP